MDLGSSLIIASVVAAHSLLKNGAVFNPRKRAISVCGRRFNLPDIGKICLSQLLKDTMKVMIYEKNYSERRAR